MDTRWASGIEYYGEHISQTAATRGATASLQARLGDRLRWRAAATLQQKFTQTEVRAGGELTHALFGATDLRWSAYVAPGAEVLPRHSYGLGLAQKVGRRLVLYGDYTWLTSRMPTYIAWAHGSSSTPDGGGSFPATTGSPGRTSLGPVVR